MSFKDALAKARDSRPEPVLLQVAVGDVLFQVEMRRLDGMEWAGVMAECPPTDEKGARLGYDTNKAALVACRRFSRLLDVEGEPVPDVDWPALFAELSGAEVGALAATWWALNMHDPNERVVALKKAWAAGSRTSSN